MPPIVLKLEKRYELVKDSLISVIASFMNRGEEITVPGLMQSLNISKDECEDFLEILDSDGYLD